MQEGSGVPLHVHLISYMRTFIFPRFMAAYLSFVLSDLGRSGRGYFVGGGTQFGVTKVPPTWSLIQARSITSSLSFPLFTSQALGIVCVPLLGHWHFHPRVAMRSWRNQIQWKSSWENLLRKEIRSLFLVIRNLGIVYGFSSFKRTMSLIL